MAIITGEKGIRLLSLMTLIKALEVELTTGLRMSSRINTHHAAQGWGVDEPRSKKRRYERLIHVYNELVTQYDKEESNANS